MTPNAAQELQDRITAAGGWIIWLVSNSSPLYPGKAIAWAVVADSAGGRKEGGELEADTLDELRQVLPAGLTQRERTPFLPLGVVETWD